MGVLTRRGRLRLAVAVLALASIMPAITVHAAAPPSPHERRQAAFDAECAQLQPSTFEVVAVPLTWQEGESLGIDALTVKSGHARGVKMTLGLTMANYGYRVQTELRTLASDQEACGTVAVRVELSMQPVTVYLADELDASRCARLATLEHEMLHVEVFREELDEAASALRADLPGVVGAGVQRAQTRGELHRRIDARVNATLADFMERRRRVLDARQATIDSPPEYARVKAACPR